jgi:hypothetical protein
MNSISTGNNVLDALASNILFSLDRYIGFYNSAEYTHLEQTDPLSTLKYISCRKDSAQKLSQLTQRNNVLGAPASNTDGVPSRDTFVSST